MPGKGKEKSLKTLATTSKKKKMAEKKDNKTKKGLVTGLEKNR